MYLVISFIVSNVEPVAKTFIILILCLIDISIFMWAPVEAHNNPIPEQKKKRNETKGLFYIFNYYSRDISYDTLRLRNWYMGICWCVLVLDYFCYRKNEKYFFKEEATMKKLTKKFYHCLSSVITFVAVLSITELNSFCILILHQPDVPEKLKTKVHKLKGSE